MAYKDRFKNFFSELSQHEVFILAASLAYTTGLALAPFVLILLSLSSFLGEDTQNMVFENFSAAVGNQASKTIQSIVENAEQHPKARGVSGIVGFFVLLLSASAIFYQLRYALDKVNEHKAKETESGLKAFLRDRLFSMGLLLGFIFLFIASLLLSTTLSVVFSGAEESLWRSVIFIINFAIFAVLFAAIYRFVPSDKLTWKKCMIAGATSALFFVIGKTLISLYLGKAGFESSYGAAGSLVVFLAWVYYSSLTLLTSYEFTNWIILGESPESRAAKT